MTVGSFFSGCGGLDLGLMNSGFNVKWANDFNHYACKVYEHNIGEIVCEDITKIKSDYFPNVDVITGGFPCQPFSNAGNRNGVHDERGNLFFETLRFIKKIKPKVVIFENVRGLLSIKNKTGNLLINDISSILSNLDKKLGYNVKYQLMLSSDYNVPQQRFRVFIIGIRKDIKKEFYFPQPSIFQSLENLLVNSIITNIADLKNLEYWDLSPQQRKMIEYIPEGGSWKNVPYEILPDRFKRIRDNIKLYHSPNFYRRFSRKEINGTITASAQPENCGIIHPIENRRYNVREIARIQSFPDSFIFPETTITNKYKVIGNAVPPLLAESIGNSILSLNIS